MFEITAIVLAAGLSTRFGAGPQTSKVLARLDGKPLVRHVVETALASRCHDVVVVTGHAASAVGAALATLPVRLVHNPAFASGMASSLKTGIASLPTTAIGAVVLLADMPLITPAIIDRLIASFEAGGMTAEAVLPVREGRRGNPVLLNRTLFAAIAALEGDQGARKLIGKRNVVECAIADAAIGFDVDTPEALSTLAALSDRLDSLHR